MSTPPIIVRRTSEADWPRVKALRLEMLADTPLAFGESLSAAEKLGDNVWRERARRGEVMTGTSLAAIVGTAEAEGRWVGTMGGYIDRSDGPLLVGVYVTPEFRGGASGVTDLLICGVEQWAVAHSDVLTLHVHSENPRAIAAYERRGYCATGRLFPYILNPHQFELEMTKRLPSAR